MNKKRASLFKVIPKAGFMFLSLFLFVQLGLASVSKIESTDYSEQLNSLSVLIRDSFFEKAEELIKNLNEDQLDAELKIKFNFLKGMLSFQAQDYEKALDFYLKSEKQINYIFSVNKEIKKNRELLIQKEELRSFIAQSNFALKRYSTAIKSLRSKVDPTEKDILILSSSYWESGKRNKASEILNQGLKSYPLSSRLIKQNAIYLADQKLLYYLYSESIKNLENKNKEYLLFVSSLLLRHNERKLSKKILEAYLLKNPNDDEVMSELAYIYYSENKYLIAQDLYLRATNLNSKHALKATEILIKTNSLSRAKYYNSFVKDQKKKVKQKFTIELKLNNYSEASHLEPELNRQGLLSDDSIIYALAYSAIKIGRLDKIDDYIKKIKDPDIFRKALKLKEWSKECSSEGLWKCVI